MCRWLTFRGDPTFLEELLFVPEYSLIHQSLRARRGATTTNGDGFGVGWYGEREEPGLFREVLPAWNDSNLRALAHQIRSHLFFAHVRASTGTETMRANCHPFVVGRWMFMHNGQIGQYEKLRRIIDNALPDELYAHRHGTTDSEAIFLHLLANGVEVDPQGAMEATIKRIEEVAEQMGSDSPFRMTTAFSDGQRLYAARYSTDPDPPSLFYRQDEIGTLVVSEPFGADEDGWQPVSSNSFLLCDPDGNVRVQPLFV